MSLESFFATDEFNLFQTIIPAKGTKKGLFIFRIIALCIFGYGLFSSVYCTIHPGPNQDHDWIWFAYFTNQSFTANVLYFIIGVVNYIRSTKGSLKGKISNRYLNVLVHIFYNCIFPFAFIVTVVYWSLISPKEDRSYYTFIYWTKDITQHLLQSILTGIDWYLITVPTSYTHAIPMSLVGIIYLIFTQIYYSIYNIWIYNFLNRANKNWLFTYVGLVTAWAILGLIFAGLQKMKNRKRKFVTDDGDKYGEYELA